MCSVSNRLVASSSISIDPTTSRRAAVSEALTISDRRGASRGPSNLVTLVSVANASCVWVHRADRPPQRGLSIGQDREGLQQVSPGGAVVESLVCGFVQGDQGVAPLLGRGQRKGEDAVIEATDRAGR
jgi:hypothetical protein